MCDYGWVALLAALVAVLLLLWRVGVLAGDRRELAEICDGYRDRWNRTAQAAKEQADERVALREQNRALAERVAAQSELLSKAAEWEKVAGVLAMEPDARIKVIDETMPRGALQLLATMQAGEIRKQRAELEKLREQLAEHERRLGYLFPSGLESGVVEDPLSPTWAREVELLEERG